MSYFDDDDRKEFKGLVCPRCLGELYKKKDTGKFVRHCKDCGSGWFIINTSVPR